MPQLDRSMEVNVFETAATFPNAMMPERSRSYFAREDPTSVEPVIMF